MDLKIIGPIKSPLKEFDSVDEFNIYYHKHKEEMDTETTHSLNKKFKINGYRITKIKGVLCLKKDRVVKAEEEKGRMSPGAPTGAESRALSEIPQCETPSISEIMERIQKLEETVNKIIDVLNGETKA